MKTLHGTAPLPKKNHSSHFALAHPHHATPHPAFLPIQFCFAVLQTQCVEGVKMMYNGQCYTSFPTPPTGLPSMSPQKRKRLTKNEEEMCMKRLTFKKEKRMSLAPLTPRVVLDQSKMQSSTERLYDVEIRRRDERECTLLKNLASKTARDPVIDPQQLAESVDRLHKVGQQHVKELSRKLHEKYNQRPPPCIISKDKMKAFTERFYTSRKVCSLLCIPKGRFLRHLCLSDVNHEMDVGLYGFGVHPRYSRLWSCTKVH